MAAMPSDSAMGTKMAATVTVSYQFRHQLKDLMKTLRATHPHYIKCIKPNGDKKPHEVVSPIVLEQLRYSGILEVVRIRREGYPVRVPVIDFYKTFEALGYGKGWSRAYETSEAQARDYCAQIMETQFGVDYSKYQIGHWKVFLKEKTLDKLYSAVSNRQTKQATAIQRCARGWLQAKRYRNVRKAVIALQSALRRRSPRQVFIAKMRALKVLQHFAAGHRLHKQFATRCHAASMLRRNLYTLGMKTC